jgi:cobalt-zinc-cadmium efflux system outer membrane protein
MAGKMWVRRAAPAVFALIIAGCGTVDPQAGFPDVAKTVSERTGKEIHWRSGGAENKAVRDAIDALLAEELDADAAVQIALLNNPALQARYEELGVAEADLVQVGLLSNPVFSASARLPVGSGGINSEFGVVQNFLDFLFLPVKTRIAAARFDAAKLKVTAEVLAFAAEVRAAAYTLEAAQNRAAVLGKIAGAAQASFALAARLREAGNASELFAANEQAASETAKIELARSQADVRAARERLNVLMGLWGPRTDWRMAAELPALPDRDAALDHLESLAVARRPDLAAARKEVEAAAATANVAEDFRWLGSVEAGASTEKDSEGSRVAGPNVSLELPVFDQHQAKIAAANSSLRRSRQRYEALAVQIRSEVRAARDHLASARMLAEHYRDVVIPLQERLVALTEQQYNFMQTGAFDLLSAKQNEIRANRDYIDAVRDYWIARSDLELAVAGGLAAAPHQD